MSIIPTEAAASTFDKESIKALLDAFEPGAMLPELEGVFGSLSTILGWAVMLGPLMLLGLGLSYLFLTPKEANYYWGYRTYFGMGSEFAWRFTQRFAGMLFTGLGAVLTVLCFFPVSKFFAMEVTAMAWKALRCLIWQAVLTLLAVLSINVTAAVKFDRKGNYRRKSKRA